MVFVWRDADATNEEHFEAPQGFRIQEDNNNKLLTRWPVPQRDHLVAVRVTRDGFGARQTKVGEFQLAVGAYQQVLWLYIPA